MTPLFRIDRTSTTNGMWYRMDQTPDNMIEKLGVSAPMPFDPEYRRDGLIWLCAVHKISDLHAFIPPDTMQSLHDIGFRLYQLNVEKFRDLDWHPIYAQEYLKSKQELSFDLLLHGRKAEAHQ